MPLFCTNSVQPLSMKYQCTSIELRAIGVAGTDLLDILSFPPDLGYYDANYEEAVQIFQHEEGWDKLVSMKKLTRIDSAIRESVPGLAVSPCTKVPSKNGITLPNGSHIPRGAWLGIALTGIHLDERYYPGAHTYDPFRFSRGRAEIAQMEEKQKTESTEAVGEKPREGIESSTEAAASEKQSDSDKAVESKLNGALLSKNFPHFALANTLVRIHIR